MISRLLDRARRAASFFIGGGVDEPPRQALPLSFAGILLGIGGLSLIFDAPRIAQALVILAVLVVIAVLGELIFGDR